MGFAVTPIEARELAGGQTTNHATIIFKSNHFHRRSKANGSQQTVV
jgi:hypothetical protein